VVVIGHLRHPRPRSAALAVFRIDSIPLICRERFSTPETSKYQIHNRYPGYAETASMLASRVPEHTESVSGVAP
jgi:hypothetical protein